MYSDFEYDYVERLRPFLSVAISTIFKFKEVKSPWYNKSMIMVDTYNNISCLHAAN